ncbi:MAG: hypothetical protein JKY52_06285 [Flavobacteriales bacterium]|nr:hypothetical protein [Flavobacteriales bacterium]
MAKVLFSLSRNAPDKTQPPYSDLHASVCPEGTAMMRERVLALIGDQGTCNTLAKVHYSINKDLLST